MMMMKSVAIGIALCATAVESFAPQGAVRSTTALQSHFSTVQTQLKDKTLLEKSLTKMGLPVTVANSAEELVTVQGYKGETLEAELAISQANGMDIGFRWNGQSYELVADLQFWEQNVPMEAFLDKIHQRYSIETILDAASADGFTPEEVVQNKVDGTVTIELSRYNMA